ncbi:uncharacterized protein BDR25DRAFT_353469 [Lindgomyces ingoldianus]|uniref:Uncharacterized protein n=1 Tax=Lindgomyces ingoldianus TaxID=673940 RepID=A0ACB6QZN2_9PLEO|nr:uncharacterized protein BDR25DRAFT_353469 [Lindgomyces ingoldianus]KAF2472453.1 hypothetical protein BDR25DRAFT_353469 [Lindgomyces ingoldianus]
MSGTRRKKENEIMNDMQGIKCRSKEKLGAIITRGRTLSEFHLAAFCLHSSSLTFARSPSLKRNFSSLTLSFPCFCRTTELPRLFFRIFHRRPNSYMKRQIREQDYSGVNLNSKYMSHCIILKKRELQTRDSNVRADSLLVSNPRLSSFRSISILRKWKGLVVEFHRQHGGTFSRARGQAEAPALDAKKAT